MPREALAVTGKATLHNMIAVQNTDDVPVIRLRQVVMNWIKAKAILVQYFGGAALTQTHLDNSIHTIRNRPLWAVTF